MRTLITKYGFSWMWTLGLVLGCLLFGGDVMGQRKSCDITLNDGSGRIIVNYSFMYRKNNNPAKSLPDGNRIKGLSKGDEVLVRFHMPIKFIAKDGRETPLGAGPPINRNKIIIDGKTPTNIKYDKQIFKPFFEGKRLENAEVSRNVAISGNLTYSLNLVENLPNATTTKNFSLRFGVQVEKKLNIGTSSTINFQVTFEPEGGGIDDNSGDESAAAKDLARCGELTNPESRNCFLDHLEKYPTYEGKSKVVRTLNDFYGKEYQKIATLQDKEKEEKKAKADLFTKYIEDYQNDDKGFDGLKIGDHIERAKNMIKILNPQAPPPKPKPEPNPSKPDRNRTPSYNCEAEWAKINKNSYWKLLKFYKEAKAKAPSCERVEEAKNLFEAIDDKAWADTETKLAKESSACAKIDILNKYTYPKKKTTASKKRKEFEKGCKFSVSENGEARKEAIGGITFLVKCDASKAADITTKLEQRGSTPLPDGHIIPKQVKKAGNYFEYAFEGLEEGEYEFTATFNSEKKKVSATIEKSLLRVELEGTSLRFRGSNPPFKLWYGTEVLGETSKRLVKRSELKGLAEYSGETIKVDVRGDNGKDETTTTIKAPGGGIPWGAVAAVAIGLLLIFAFAMRNFLTKTFQKYPITRALFGLKPPKVERKGEGDAAAGETAQKTKDGITIIANKGAKAEDTSKLKISKRKAVEEKMMDLGTLDPKSAATDKSYYPFELLKSWKESAVQAVFLKHSCAAAINTQVARMSDAQDIAAAELPEIGGFLMGRYRLLEDLTYAISIEQYVPATAKRHGVYEVELDMTEIDDAMRNHPNLVVIGWFHTHPGHSLFLSKPDLRIHRNWFTKPYQIAMEMDPLTVDMDFTFFTWKDKKGNLNTSKDTWKEQNWYSWDDLNRWRRMVKREIS